MSIEERTRGFSADVKALLNRRVDAYLTKYGAVTVSSDVAKYMEKSAVREFITELLEDAGENGILDPDEFANLHSAIWLKS